MLLEFEEATPRIGLLMETKKWQLIERLPADPCSLKHHLLPPPTCTAVSSSSLSWAATIGSESTWASGSATAAARNACSR